MALVKGRVTAGGVRRTDPLSRRPTPWHLGSSCAPRYRRGEEQGRRTTSGRQASSWRQTLSPLGEEGLRHRQAPRRTLRRPKGLERSTLRWCPPYAAWMRHCPLRLPMAPQPRVLAARTMRFKRATRDGTERH